MQINWLSKLQEIPVIHSAGLLSVTPMQQGLGNQSLLLTTSQGNWVFRMNQTQLGVNRQLEAQVLQSVKSLNIAPKVIENNPEAGYLIVEHLQQSTWKPQDFSSTKKVKKLQSKLEQLHRIQFTAPASRLDHRIPEYLKDFKVVPHNVSSEITQQLKQLADLRFWSACQYLCHYDLNPLNLLGDHPWIIDWEFAGQGHALIDWLVMEHESGHDLSSFYPEEINPDWVQPLKKLIHNMMVLWRLNLSA
ncbi:MAG: phosphotransferase [Marinicella sp.]